MIGLTGVKKHVRSLVAQLQLAQKKKLAGVAGSKLNATMHMVFSGNPGTGKTTVARMVAELLQVHEDWERSVYSYFGVEPCALVTFRTHNLNSKYQICMLTKQTFSHHFYIRSLHLHSTLIGPGLFEARSFG